MRAIDLFGTHRTEAYVATKKQLQTELDEANTANEQLYTEKERLRKKKEELAEELRVAKLRLASVFTVNDNAKLWLTEVFGPLTGDFDKSDSLHHYEATDHRVSVTFDPRSTEIIMADPDEMVGRAMVKLSPSGVLEEESVRRIVEFLDDVAFSRLPSRTTRREGSIDFTRPAPTVDVGTPSDTLRAATDEEAAAERALDDIKY